MKAEELMLESYCEKAQLRDGMDVLDLGCGTSRIQRCHSSMCSKEDNTRLGQSQHLPRAGNEIENPDIHYATSI